MKTLFTIFLITLLSSCSSLDSLPNEEMALKKVKSEINDITNSCIDIVDFKKTDGVKQILFGQEHYQFSYTIKLKFKIDSYQPFAMQDHIYFYTEKEYRIGLKQMHSADEYAKFKKGEEIQIKGVVSFDKTENGWK